ncbi:MAG: dipeptidase [Thermacetogeniaceae bacterium]
MICVDMHCDSVSEAHKTGRDLAQRSQQGQADLPRLRQAGIKIQFFALFPERAYHPGRTLYQVLRLLDYASESLREEGGAMVITTRHDLEQCLATDKLGALLTIEGGEPLEGEVRILRALHRLGVRGLGLTWNNRNELGDGVDESRSGGGLTRFGRQVVQEMNRLGMIVDVSHLSEAGFWAALEQSSAPVIASHSNCGAIREHPRNLTDQQIKAIAQQDGLVGVNLVPQFVGPPGAGPPSLIDHIDHICELVGDDYVGFGCDFDGTDELISGVHDVTDFPVLIAALRDRGYGDASIGKICGLNCLRVLRSVLPER